MCTKICRRSAPEFHQKQSKRPKFSGATSTTVYFLLSAKTSLFFSFYEGSWSFMLSLSIIYACFYACSLEFFVLSIIIVSQPLTPLRRLLRLQSVTQNARDGGSLRGGEC